jgi:dTMP kinase
VDAVLDAVAGVLRVGRAVGQELGGEGAGDGALAGAGRAVEEVGVAGPAVRGQRGGENRAGVGMALGAGERRHLWKATAMGGRLITIEGLDGVGKTTLASGLVSALRDRGVSAELLREPGGVELAERIRALVKDPSLAVDPRAEALLYAAARAQLCAERVVPLLDAGTWVLLDRFVDASLAYQGAGRGLGVSEVAAINAFATGGLTPDRTLLLRADAATRAGRQAVRGEAPDRLELGGEEFFSAIAAAYDELAAAAPDRFRVLDAGASCAEVREAAVAALADLLPSGA